MDYFVKKSKLSFKKMYYQLLQKFFKFDKWHLSPGEERLYVEAVTRLLDKIIDENRDLDLKSYVLEVGCGLGDVISLVNWPSRQKLGLDISGGVIRAAKFAHPFTSFKRGSFGTIHNKNILVLICVNFLFSIEYSELYESFKGLVEDNVISYIVIDRVKAPPYRYAHDYDRLFGEFGYKKWKTSRGYEAAGGSRRYIVAYKKQIEACGENYFQTSCQRQ